MGTFDGQRLLCEINYACKCFLCLLSSVLSHFHPNSLVRQYKILFIELFLLKVDIFNIIKQINYLLYLCQAMKHGSSALHFPVLRYVLENNWWKLKQLKSKFNLYWSNRRRYLLYAYHVSGTWTYVFYLNSHINLF